jgi:hypothetical protein
MYFNSGLFRLFPEQNILPEYLISYHLAIHCQLSGYQLSVHWVIGTILLSSESRYFVAVSFLLLTYFSPSHDRSVSGWTDFSRLSSGGLLATLALRLLST